MKLTSSGRPLGSYPFFKFRDGEGGYFLALSRLDVSDVRNSSVAEAFYAPFFKRDARDGMETWEFHLFDTTLTLFFTSRGIQHHVERNQTSEE
jgi:hypothetical protein